MDEQRQVVAQWKRKTAKVQGEQNDLRMLLEEQTSRNALLEKRARKFDSELSLANEERKIELQSKDKLQREFDQLKSIKNQLEDQLQVSLSLCLLSYIDSYFEIFVIVKISNKP